MNSFLLRRFVIHSSLRCPSSSGFATSSSSSQSAANESGGVRRLSGAQKEVLQLYKSWLREIRRKNVPHEQHAEMTAYVRLQFEKHRSVRKLDIDRIEQLMRKGRRQLRDFQHTDGGFKISH